MGTSIFEPGYEYLQGWGSGIFALSLKGLREVGLRLFPKTNFAGFSLYSEGCDQWLEKATQMSSVSVATISLGDFSGKYKSLFLSVYIDTMC